MQLIRRTSFARLSQKDLSAAAARHEMLYFGPHGRGRARGLRLLRSLWPRSFRAQPVATRISPGAVMEGSQPRRCAARFDELLRRRSAAGRIWRAASIRPLGPARRLSARRQSDRRRSLRSGSARGHESRKKDKFGNLRVLQHDLGPSEMGSAMLNSANLEARQDGRRKSRFQADFTDAMMKGCKLVARQSAPGEFRRRQSGERRPVELRSSPAPISPVPCSSARGLTMAMLQGADLTGTLTEEPCGRVSVRTRDSDRGFA